MCFNVLVSLSEIRKAEPRPKEEMFLVNRSKQTLYRLLLSGKNSIGCSYASSETTASGLVVGFHTDYDMCWATLVYLELEIGSLNS